MKENSTKTLAVTVEVLNEKLDEIINKQNDIEKELQRNNKVIMQRINKLQEHNEIEDMRSNILNEHINKIAQMILAIKKQLYWFKNAIQIYIG